MRKLFHAYSLIAFLIYTSPLSTEAQLFETNVLYPNTGTITGKYGRGFWSLEYVDARGRVIGKENHFKKELRSAYKMEYDDHDNKILEINTFDCNEPGIDTIQYVYKYAGNRIIYQRCTYSDNDSTVIELTENLGDTLLKYRKQDFYYRPDSKKTEVLETQYILTYKGNRLVSKKKFEKDRKSTKITNFDYYNNGRVKRRVIENIPKTGGVYIGGPGSDDMSYKYRLDSQGRIKVEYVIVEGKKYKMAKYRYKAKG